MESAVTLLKENTPMALMLVVGGFLLQYDLGGDIQEIRTDMAEEFKVVRAEIIALRTDMNEEFKAVRAEMAASDLAIRADMYDGFGAIRAEIAAELTGVRSEIADSNERLARVETRLDSIEDWLYRDTAVPPR